MPSACVHYLLELPDQFQINLTRCLDYLPPVPPPQDAGVLCSIPWFHSPAETLRKGSFVSHVSQE
jgi:hypothetical protein